MWYDSLIVPKLSKAVLYTEQKMFVITRLKKYEDESKLLTLELTNKSAELGKVCKKEEYK